MVEAARREGISLNQFVCALLASGMRWSWQSGEPDHLVESETRSKDRTSPEEYREIWNRAFN
jgi:hypothetical protein